jgi:hypothetical protein
VGGAACWIGHFRAVLPRSGKRQRRNEESIMTDNIQRPSGQSTAAQHAVMDEGDELQMLRQEVSELDDFHAALDELRERRISALEEVLAAPWQRRWLLAWRFRRRLRASVRACAWAGDSWHDRRGQAMSEERYGL